MAHKRKISVEKNSSQQFTSPFLLQTANNNIPPPSPSYEKAKPNYTPSPQVVNKNALDVPRDELAKDRRAMSS